MIQKRHSRFRTRSRRGRQGISVLPRLHGDLKAGVADSVAIPVAGTVAARTPIAGAVAAGAVPIAGAAVVDLEGLVVAADSTVSGGEAVAKKEGH